MSTKNQTGGSGAGRETKPDTPADEISIPELLSDIVTQWKVVAGTVVLLTALAAFYMYLKGEVYRYTVDVEVGQTEREELSQKANFIMVPPATLEPPLLESLAAVSSRLETSWLPELVEEVSGEDHYVSTEAVDFDISNPEDPRHNDSLIIRISAVASREHEQAILAILRKAAARVTTHHAQFLEEFQKRAETRIATLEGKLEELERELADHEQRVARLRKRVDSSRTDGLSAAVELNALIPQGLELREERREIEVSMDRSEHEAIVLRRAAEALSREDIDKSTLEEQRKATAAVKANASMQPTRVMGMPGRSTKPVGVAPKVVITLAGVIGLGLGLILALIVQAVVRERAGKGN